MHVGITLQDSVDDLLDGLLSVLLDRAFDLGELLFRTLVDCRLGAASLGRVLSVGMLGVVVCGNRMNMLCFREWSWENMVSVNYVAVVGSRVRLPATCVGNIVRWMEPTE